MSTRTNLLRDGRKTLTCAKCLIDPLSPVKVMVVLVGATSAAAVKVTFTLELGFNEMGVGGLSDTP